MAETSATPTESVSKALRLLALFRGADVPVRVAEASALTGLPRSTTHRLLATLQALEFIRQDRASRAYYPGDALLALAQTITRDADVRATAHAEMAALAARTGETANFIVLRDRKATFVDGIESGNLPSIAANVGVLADPHATAGGKVLLATLADEAVRRIFPNERLPARTPATIVSRLKLLHHLAAVRGAGYATSAGENTRTIFAVAAAVRTPGGDVLGALSLATPPERMTPQARATLALEVRRSAERIAAHFP